MILKELLNDYVTYVGNCKHLSASGNIFTGLFCHECGARNFHSTNSGLPDEWFLFKKPIEKG